MDLSETWQRDGTCVKGDSCNNFRRNRSRDSGEIGKIVTFFCVELHRFGHFCFSDFHETWQECLNRYPHKSFRNEILIFFARGRFSPNCTFWSILGALRVRELEHRDTFLDIRIHAVYSRKYAEDVPLLGELSSVSYYFELLIPEVHQNHVLEP